MTGTARDQLRHFPAAFALAAFAVLLFLTTPTAGDFWWFDSPRHAMNSVYLHDLIFNGGLTHPIEFSRDYYRRYPAINVGFYPPFLYISTVPFLAIFGASHGVAQAVVTLYGLMAGAMTYLICMRKADRLMSVSTALCVMAIPSTALWVRQVQLDVPAVALILTTVYCLIRYLDDGKKSSLFATCVFLGLAILTRVQAIFLVPGVLYFLFVKESGKRPILKIRLLAVGLAGLIALPSILMAAYFARLNQTLASNMAGMPSLFTVDNWGWYARQLPTQLGIPTLIVFLSGLAIGFFKFVRGSRFLPAIVLVCFVTCSWLFFTVVSNKDPRFNLPSLPFLAILGAWGLAAVAPRAGSLLMAALASWVMFQCLAVDQVPVVSGFDAAVKVAESATPKNQNILISAHRDGNFIYDLRVDGTRPDIGVRRADKILVEINIVREMGINDKQLDAQGVWNLLVKENVATVVAQTGYLSEQPTMQSLETLLASSAHFEKVGTVPLQGATMPKEKQLVIYKRKLVCCDAAARSFH